MRLYVILTVLIFVTGCVSTQPVLYPYDDTGVDDVCVEGVTHG